MELVVVVLGGILALMQVKTNIIASARIEWAQNFRKLVSKLLTDTNMLNFHLKQVIELVEKDQMSEAEKLYNQKIELFKEVNESTNQIKLFLNNHKENEHIQLQELIEKYIAKVNDYKSLHNSNELIEMEQNIIKQTQQMLKQTWEDAKTLNIKEALNITWSKKNGVKI